jgi:hypothetical protein
MEISAYFRLKYSFALSSHRYSFQVIIYRAMNSRTFGTILGYRLTQLWVSAYTGNTKGHGENNGGQCSKNTCTCNREWLGTNCERDIGFPD